jgi:uncharacterized protein (TIGR03435 family)
MVLGLLNLRAADGPEFEVASIKPGDPGARGGYIQPSPGRFTSTNMPLIGLITFAYDVRPDQISGAPGWIDSQRYDILATSESPVGDPHKLLDQQRLMLQKLLADRFQLRVRHETRERPVYTLTVDKNGPKMKENNDLKSAPFPIIVITGRGHAKAQIVSMSYIVQFLESQLGRIVLDRTGLKGSYDFTLQWTPDPAFEPGLGAAPDAPPDASGPSIFTALRQQLGLGLESTKGPVEFIVVDRVEKPSEN